MDYVDISNQNPVEGTNQFIGHNTIRQFISYLCYCWRDLDSDLSAAALRSLSIEIEYSTGVFLFYLKWVK